MTVDIVTGRYMTYPDKQPLQVLLDLQIAEPQTSDDIANNAFWLSHKFVSYLKQYLLHMHHKRRDDFLKYELIEAIHNYTSEQLKYFDEERIATLILSKVADIDNDLKHI